MIVLKTLVHKSENSLVFSLVNCMGLDLRLEKIAFSSLPLS